jgi:hypothetical protein
MRIAVVFPLTPTISFISYGEIMLDLRVFYLHAYFEERNLSIEWEVNK